MKLNLETRLLLSDLWEQTLIDSVPAASSLSEGLAHTKCWKLWPQTCGSPRPGPVPSSCRTSHPGAVNNENGWFITRPVPEERDCVWKDWVIAILLINNITSSTDSWAIWTGSSESQQNHHSPLEHRSPIRTTFGLCSSASFSDQVTRLPPSSTQLSEPLLPASASSSFLLPFLFPFHCPALSFPLLP